ncbi:protein Aim7p [Diutina catenulata]
MSSGLYTFSQETLQQLRKFRFSSGKGDSMEALVCVIDKSSYEVKIDGEVVTSMEELAEELPDNTPRYVILSYPIKLSDGRLKVPLVLLYWIPRTCGQESRMLYAGAVELIREKAGVAKMIKIEEEDELEEVESQLL